MKKVFLFLLIVLCFAAKVQAVEYPYAVKYITLRIEDKGVRMAYMDVQSPTSNGRVVLLLHGKNFNGYYWKDVITFLSHNGYRVIVPDQVGWGKSDKPDIHYSFHLLAYNTKALLDTLGVSKVNVVGHSIGGMLATRLTLMYPDVVERLILEDPIGLEDYKTFIPYHTVDSQYRTEMKATYASLKTYQQGYYPQWQPEYEQYVQAQYEALQVPTFKQATWASSLTYQMIYEQPVVYEFKNITRPTLIIIGLSDRTVVGKDLLPKQEADKYGNYPKLGKWLQSQIKGSELAEFENVGHIPHIQSPEAFQKKLLHFLQQ